MTFYKNKIINEFPKEKQMQLSFLECRNQKLSSEKLRADKTKVRQSDHKNNNWQNPSPKPNTLQRLLSPMPGLGLR